jgi:hypothetical protein
MRCPDCNKFVGLETQDPEVDGLEVNDSSDSNAVAVTGTVRIVRACADCGTEMKEASFDIDTEVEIEGWQSGDKFDGLEIEETSIESTESGGGRYAKNMIGYKLDLKVTGKLARGGKKIDFEAEDSVEDSLQASAFDEMV